MTRILHLLLLLLLLAAAVTAAQAQDLFADGFETPFAPPLGRGGSNYLWFGQAPGCAPDARDAYGLLKRYHEITPQGPVRSIAQQQLAAMRAKGMARLSLGVFFMHQPADSGTLIDSDDPAEVAQTAQNLALLLADVKAAGFVEVLFRFFPIGNINPSQPEFPGHSTDPASAYVQRVDEYWQLIEHLRPALASAGLPYRIDLMVEGAPRDSDLPFIQDPWKYPSNDTWSRTVRALWQRYVSAYGTADTIGFSTLVDAGMDAVRARVRHMRYVYEGVYPHVFGVDLYATPTVDEFAKFASLHRAMVEENPPGAFWHATGWIVAEAYYEDPLAVDAIGEGIARTGRAVFYLTQWPLDRAGPCLGQGDEQVHVNVPPPYGWTVWGGHGF